MPHAYRLKPYQHPRLKWVVRAKIRGKWVRKYFEKKAEAQTYCEQKNTEVFNQGRESVEFPSWLRVMAQEGDERLRPYGKTIGDAVAFYVKHLESAQGAISLQNALAELVENRRANGASKRYCADLRLRIGRFAASFPDRKTSEFSTRDIDDWLMKLKLAPVTRNTFRRDLRTLFSFCLKRGYCSENPVLESSLAKEVAAPVGILTVDEVSALLRAAPKEIRASLAIGAFAGLRAAEIERLDWSEIDLEAGLIEVTASKAKTAQRRLVKISENLRAWLEPLSTTSGSVVPSNMRKLTLEARERANLKEWPPNALRHSYASHHIAHFNDAGALALEMGHTNTAMIFQHYREVVRPKEAARYWQIYPSGT